MLIGELASRAGVRRSTVRYYERAGLLPPPPRTSGGYRTYGDRELARLRFIRTARSLGLGLGEISGILTVRESGDRPCSHVLLMLEARVRALSEQIAALEGLRAELEGVIRRGPSVTAAEGDLCPIIEHSGPLLSASRE